MMKKPSRAPGVCLYSGSDLKELKLVKGSLSSEIAFVKTIELSYLNCPLGSHRGGGTTGQSGRTRIKSGGVIAPRELNDPGGRISTHGGCTSITEGCPWISSLKKKGARNIEFSHQCFHALILPIATNSLSSFGIVGLVQRNISTAVRKE